MAREEESSELLRWLKKQSQIQATPSLKTGDLESSLYNLQRAVNPVEKSFSAIPGVGNMLYTSLSNANVAFQDLSKSGLGFRGDLIGLSTAAANSRLTLGEFAAILKDSNETLIGLGGTATRGAEAFAKLSKSFLDDRSADQLRLLGYSSKDLNEIMALQAVTVRGKFESDKQQQQVLIENSQKLATEMDLMARLTGKSREAQMEQMKKAQADMQFEAAIRLKTAGMTAEEAAKFEANARSQYRDAELRGQGQMFKEIFSTGQIMSKEAATQAALNQEQAAATRKQAQISADASIESNKREQEATAAGREARAAAVADMNNKSKLQQMALGDAGGEATRAFNQSAAAQIGYTRGLESIAKEHQLDLNNRSDLAKAQKIQEERARKEAEGRDDAGKSVNELNKSMILFEARAKDVSAALNESLLTPLRNLDPAFASFNKMLSDAGTNFGGTGKGARPAIAEAAEKGRAGKELGDVTGLGGDFLKAAHAGSKLIEDGSKKASEYIVKAGDFFSDVTKNGASGILEGLTEKAKEVAPAIVQPAKDAAKTLEGPLELIYQKIIKPLADAATQKPPQRNTGSIGMTGKLFEDWGNGTLVELHGLEGVVKPEHMSNMAKGMAGQGAAKAFEGLKNQLSTVSNQGGIDVSKISKEISTSISSATPKIDTKVEVKGLDGTARSDVKQTAKSDMASKVEVINWPKNFASPATQTAAQKLDSPTASPTQASVRAVDNKIEAESKPFATQGSVRAVDNAIEVPKIDWKSAAGEFGEEMKLPFGSMMDEFGSNFDKVIADVNQGLGNVNVDQFSVNLEAINKDLVNSLPVIEIAQKQEEFKSQFTDSQKKLIDDYNGISDENRQFNIERLEYHNNQDLFIRDKHNAIVSGLEKAKNERELTEEEEHQLLESAAIGSAAEERINKRQEELDVLKNLDEFASKRKIEINEISNAVVLKANEAAMLELNDIAEDIEATFSTVDIPPIQVEDVVAQARDNLMLEANEIAEDIEGIAKSIPLATTSMSDMTMAADEISASMADLIPTDSIIAAKDAMMLEANEIAEDIQGALPVDPVRQLSDNLMFEANEMAEDINENFSSMIDDAAFSSGPGDASIAGLDFVAEDIKKALPIDEFGGLAEAIELQKNMEKNTSGMDVQAEDGTVSQGIKINPETGETYSTVMPEASKKSLDEQVSSTNPFFNDKGEINLNSINLPGMKKFGADLKQQTASVKKDENQSDAETERLKRQSEKKDDNKSGTETKADTKATATSGAKEATLSDVVKQLSSLNKNMQELITQNNKLFNDQIKATKANNKNNFVGVY